MSNYARDLIQMMMMIKECTSYSSTLAVVVTSVAVSGTTISPIAAVVHVRCGLYPNIHPLV